MSRDLETNILKINTNLVRKFNYKIQILIISTSLKNHKSS